MKYIFVFCLCLYGVLAKHEIYDGHSVYEIDVKNTDEIKLLNELENQLFLDVWSHALPGRPGQILVGKTKKAVFENALKQAGVQFKVAVENIKEKLELEDLLLASANARSNNLNGSLSFDRILTFEEVSDFLDELAKNYPDRVTVDVAGNSIQGRPLKYIKISTTNFEDTSKPIIMMESLIHSREWISLPSTLYAIQKLVIDVTESDLIENIDWIILPVANPDGYVFTHTNNRFWRKNRRTGFMIGDFCAGIDLNRNFDIHWGTASSNSVCLDTFHGSGPLSEPETQAIAALVNRYRDRMGLFLDMHSFGSMILFGYGNGILPSNALTVNLVGVRMAQAIDRVKWPGFRDYIVGNVAMVLYDASGSAGDYAMDMGVPLSYTYELPAYRDRTGTMDGFLVDPDFIEQAGFETWEGIKAGARSMLQFVGRK